MAAAACNDGRNGTAWRRPSTITCVVLVDWRVKTNFLVDRAASTSVRHRHQRAMKGQDTGRVSLSLGYRLVDGNPQVRSCSRRQE